MSRFLSLVRPMGRMRNNAHGQLKGALKKCWLNQTISLLWGIECLSQTQTQTQHNNRHQPTQRSITAEANQKGIDFYELRTVHPTTLQLGMKFAIGLRMGLEMDLGLGLAKMLLLMLRRFKAGQRIVVCHVDGAGDGDGVTCTNLCI